jgi:hypothetical protein
MKEVLTKNFWQGVKKTFDDARNGTPPPEDKTPQPAVEPAIEPIPDSPPEHPGQPPE